MKSKSCLFGIFLLGILLASILFFNFSFVKGDVSSDVEVPSAGGISKDNIEDTLDKIPIGEDGSFDKEKFKPYETKLEEKIEEFDKVLASTDFVFDFLYGIRLRLSWEFVCLFFLIIVFLVFFSNLATSFIHKPGFSIAIGAFLSLFLLGILRFYVFVVNFITKISETWWMQLIIIFVFISLIVIDCIVAKALKKGGKKNKEKEIDTSLKMIKGISKGISDGSDGIV